MIALVLTAALLAHPAPARGPVAQAPARPRDPWVFRCALDGRPRSVVVALADDLWVAYDASGVSLVKAWRGDVHLQGAVYDTVHGPQPVARGPVWAVGLEGPVWFAEVGGELVELEPRWRGHAFVEGRVELRMEAALPGGGVVRVAETPERVRSEALHERKLRIPAGRTGLARTWRVEAPEGVQVLLRDRRQSPWLWPRDVRGMRAAPDGDGALVALATDAETMLVYYFDEPAEDTSGAGDGR